MLYNLDNCREEDDWVPILGIDPSSTKCGFAVLKYNLVDKRIILCYADTLNGNVAIRPVKDSVKLYGERETRNLGYGIFLRTLAEEHDPAVIICEAAYARFIAAYCALIEQQTVFRVFSHNWCVNTPFKTVQASAVKRNMKVPGNNGDKELMRAALLKRELLIGGSIKLSDLDEHSIDAICIALFWIDELIGG